MSVSELITKLKTEILNPLIGLLFVLATVVFMWGVIVYVIGGRGSDEDVTRGKKIMFYGIIGMAVMASAWGIVQLLCNFFTTCAQLPF